MAKDKPVFFAILAITSLALFIVGTGILAMSGNWQNSQLKGLATADELEKLGKALKG